MVLDVDYYIGKSAETKSSLESSIIRIYGATQEGHSVLVHVHGFRSYFYVMKPKAFNATEKSIEQLRLALSVFSLFESG